MLIFRVLGKNSIIHALQNELFPNSFGLYVPGVLHLPHLNAEAIFWINFAGQFYVMAKDIYHEHVKEALIKDGWTITDDPFILKLGGRDSVEIDLGAEKMLVAEKGNRQIVVEVKSFLNRSIIYDFHAAYGQFSFYAKALQKFHVGKKIFLAMPEDIYNDFMDKPYYREFLLEELRLLVFNPIEKTISTWINELDSKE